MPLIAIAIAAMPIVLLILTIDTVRTTDRNGASDFQLTYRAYGA